VLISPPKRFKLANFKKCDSLKLNMGCDKVKFPSCVNIDIEPGADLVIDVRKGLPFDDNGFDFIYSKHFLENLTFEEGEKLCGESLRCLKKEGVSRIAMPELDYLIEKYNRGGENQDVALQCLI